MKLSEIKQRIGERLGIKALTEMQLVTSKTTLPARMMLLAPTGSGKTLAFTIPVLRSLREPSSGGVQALVLVPTRELALQVGEVIRKLANPDFKTAVFYGGHSMESERNTIDGAPDIVIGTPGRILDHIQRKSLEVGDIPLLVLDEYDKSLELGFVPDMKSIVTRMRRLTSILLTSATALGEMPDFLGNKPFEILDYNGEASTATPNIEFLRVDSPSADKLDTLEALLRDLGDKRTIVFVNHRDAAERVYTHLLADGFSAGLYHGGLEQDRRERALIMFANGTDPILVSTDLASRGLDIAEVGAVVHYHLPTSPEAMTHRNGRTGRMGGEGRAYAIISEHDKVPDFFPSLDTYWPEGTADPARSKWSTLHFSAGKKEKISRGDIAGFLIQKGGLSKEEVGRIDICDRQAYAAVPTDKARATVKAVAPYKIKNTRVRVSVVV